LFDTNRPTSDAGRNAVEAALLRAARPADAPAVEDRPVDEPGSRYIDWFVPGLIGVNLMGGGLWGVGYSIVDMRVRKLLKRFLATPMRKRDFLLSIVLSRMVFVVPEIALLLAFSRWIFGVEVRGNFGSLLVLVLLGSACFLGIGLLIASRARTQEAAGGLIQLVMLPMYLLSGVFFSYERFPEAAQPFLRALPLTALNDAMRAVMIDGATLASQAVPVATVAAWAAASFALALRFFRWV
jgi:ABC-type multidrug transport system permease subunit